MRPVRYIKLAIPIAAVWLSLMACKGGNEHQLPVDFVWDRVVCEECKMALSDPHYAAQVIDKGGKAFYFDDIGCSVLWLQRQSWKANARVWVNDVKTTDWIDAKDSNWIYGDPKTPMGYGFAATQSPVEDKLDFDTVTKWVLIGKTLVNENLVKHLKHDNKQPDVEAKSETSIAKQRPLKADSDPKAK